MKAFATTFASLVFALGLLFAPSPAFAEEDENVVNTHQLPDSSFVYDTPLVDLADADSYYDKQTVQVVGEAIGDVLNADVAGLYKWVTLGAVDQTAGATVSVYMTASQAGLIDTLGRYGSVGTTLQVRGTFYLTCEEHEGITCLHADSVSVMRKGTETPDEFSLRAFIPGAVMVALGLALMLLFRYLRERQR